MANAKHTAKGRSIKSQVCQTRQIKVSQYHYMHPRKDNPLGNGRNVPWIQLKGDWLQQAGFNIDTPIKVRVMDGCLVLTAQE